MYKLKRRAQDVCAWERPEEIPVILHRLLRARGISSAQEADVFLRPLEQPLHDPLLFPGVAQAAEELRSAIARGERICVYGDYDVDGVSACAILAGALEELGADVRVRIPLRAEEGYGLNENAVRELAGEGVQLLVTVDCGISDKPNTDLAMELGMRVIVTDHHRTTKEALPACILCSAQVGEYPCPHLCGAGVAFKLACALDERFAREYIDIAALATVADIVPLVGENRTIVAAGLRKMNEGLRPGLLALMREAGMEKRALTEDTLGFQIGPRLNAGGRLGSAERSYRLLRAKTLEEAEQLAKELNDENNARRMLERKVAQDAHVQLAAFDFTQRRAIVLRSGEWSSGVIGIAASRLVEEYHYPVILFAQEGDVLKGSCRSIEGVDIYLAIKSCAEYLTKYGGHTAAAGLTLDAVHFERFCADIDRYLRENIPPETWIPTYGYDVEAQVREADVETCLALERMRPFGMGNPAPLFLTEFAPAGVRRIGSDGSHLKLAMLGEDDARLDAIWFGRGEMADELEPGQERRAIGALQVNEFQGVRRAQCMLSRILPAQADEQLRKAQQEHIPQAFLTEILYTEGKTGGAEALDLRQAAALLAENVQGVVFAAAGVGAARELYEALVACEAPFLPDVVFGAWTQDARCFSTIAVCPCGPVPRGVKSIVALDIDPAFFAARAKETGAALYALRGVQQGECWTDSLPDVDALREVYVAALRLSSRPLRVRDTEALVREVALEADLPEHAVFAALLALQDMGLAEICEEPLALQVSRGIKIDPMQNKVFQNILQLRERRRLL
ncbi:MAG: single-stranded-DNA-specific exonuclease RecJ [Eubacteriales bacterium]|nr:single-stranded-DNA-specific exonuclease RecJ [Eubacteriales bacterium]